MVRGATEGGGLGQLGFIDNIMGRHLYRSILEEYLQPSVDKLCLGRDWIFQQDNDTKHTARLVKDWLLYYAPRQLCSPSKHKSNGALEKLIIPFQKQGIC
ncbi:hypothetical protein Trydic_g12253 [Trypoxylus dichotomus]